MLKLGFSHLTKKDNGIRFRSYFNYTQASRTRKKQICKRDEKAYPDNDRPLDPEREREATDLERDLDWRADLAFGDLLYNKFA